MITTREFASSLYGLWLLLKFDPTGLACFERTVGGFWRSYIAALILAPLNFLHAIMTFDPEQAALGFAPYLAVEALSYVLAWTVFPFAMLYVSGLLQRENRLLDYLVPYNWLQLAVGLVAFPVILLFDVNLITAQGVEFLQLLILGISISYAVFLARTALGVALSTAFGLVVFDIVLNLLVGQIVAKI